MKLTKTKLKQIIREEIEATLVDEGLGDFVGKMKATLTGKAKKITKWVERAEKDFINKFKNEAGWNPEKTVQRTPSARDIWIPSTLDHAREHRAIGLKLIKDIGGTTFGGRTIDPELFKYFRASLKTIGELIEDYRKYSDRWFDEKLAQPGFERSEREREEREKEEKEKRENPYLRDFEAEGEQMGYDSGPSQKWKDEQARKRDLARRLAEPERIPWRTHGGGSGRV
tara:strand:- start:133 stop:813 length:681 start_codon:yes stop_codon:yes gene_type:complete